MTFRLCVAGIAFLAACSATKAEPVGDQPVAPPPPMLPPERLLREAPEFTFRDYDRRREFFLRSYHDPEFSEELVTVIDLDHPEGERLATVDEFEYALRVFEQHWKNKGLEERLQFHQKLRHIEQARSTSLLDDMIRHTRDAMKDFADRKFDIDAQIRARVDTGTDKEADPMAFLRRESDRLQFEIALRQTRLRLLEYKAWLRDQHLSRSLTPR